MGPLWNLYWNEASLKCIGADWLLLERVLPAWVHPVLSLPRNPILRVVVHSSISQLKINYGLCLRLLVKGHGAASPSHPPVTRSSGMRG